MPKTPIYDPGCTLCPLHETATHVCLGAAFSRVYEPGWHPKILFVMDSPSKGEDRSGKPGDSPGIALLKAAVKHYGVRNWALTYAVKCYTPNDKKPTSKSMKACAPYLKRELKRYKPEIVVPLGAVALKRLCGLNKITDWAGRVYEPPGREWKVYPMVSPNAVLNYEARFQQPFESQMRGLARLSAGATATPSNYVRVQLREAVARIKKLAAIEEPYGFDIETGPDGERGNAHNPRFNRIITAAFSSRQDEGFWFVWPTEQSEVYDLVNAFMELLRSKATMVAHNAPFEIKHLLWHVVRKADEAAGDPTYWGEYDANPSFEPWSRFEWECDDSLLLYYMLHEDAKGYYGLDHVRREVAPEMPDYDAKVMGLVNAGTPHHLIDLDDLGEYNTGDADATLRLRDRLRRKVHAKRGLKYVYESIMRPCAFAVARAELNGRKIDFDQVEKLHKDFEKTQVDSMAVMRGHKAVLAYCAEEGKDPEDWNPGSSKQVGPVIFEYLGLKALKQTATGQDSVGAKFIEPYKEKSRFVRNYLAWKEARTLDNNYLTPYVEKTAPNGFLYGGFLLFGTATGRPSSVNPNLQNWSPLLRTSVVSRFMGGKILVADYSQLELRLMAQEAQVELLLEAYRKKLDVHAITATKVCAALFKRKVSLEEVLDQHVKAEANHAQSWRQDYGKRPNFALLYDAFPKRFSEEFHVPIDVATIIHGVWHDTYPEVGRYHERIRTKVREAGYIQSRMGRRRRLPAAVGDPPYKTQDWWAQKAAFREAGNFPIQSLGSDINMMAFARAQAMLRGRTWMVVPMGTTHDSQEWDTDAKAIDEFAPALRRVMVEETHSLFPWLTVPLEVDIKVGDSWGNLKKWKAA